MKNFFIAFSIIAGCLAAVISFVPLRLSAQASNPLIITWQANNYFPADYGGKALVTPNTLVIASVELIRNGKFTDTTGADIRWYVGDELAASGIGLKTLSFSAKQEQSGYQALRVSVKAGDASFENSVQIPISRPSVVINIPSLGGTVRAGSQITLQAIPFFFNAGSLQNLAFDWLINNRRAAGDGNRITVNVGTPQSAYQNSIPVSATVQNSENPYEFNKGSVILSIIQ